MPNWKSGLEHKHAVPPGSHPILDGSSSKELTQVCCGKELDVSRGTDEISRMKNCEPCVGTLSSLHPAHSLELNASNTKPAASTKGLRLKGGVCSFAKRGMVDGLDGADLHRSQVGRKHLPRLLFGALQEAVLEAEPESFGRDAWCVARSWRGRYA